VLPKKYRLNLIEKLKDIPLPGPKEDKLKVILNLDIHKTHPSIPSFNNITNEFWYFIKQLRNFSQTATTPNTIGSERRLSAHQK